MMRTTLAIDDHLLADAKERARRDGQTLGSWSRTPSGASWAPSRTANGLPSPS